MYKTLILCSHTVYQLLPVYLIVNVYLGVKQSNLCHLSLFFMWCVLFSIVTFMYFYKEFSVKSTVFKVHIFRCKFLKVFLLLLCCYSEHSFMRWFVFIHSFPYMCLCYWSCFVQTCCFLFLFIVWCQLAFAIYLLFWHELRPLSPFF